MLSLKKVVQSFYPIYIYHIIKPLNNLLGQMDHYSKITSLEQISVVLHSRRLFQRIVQISSQAHFYKLLLSISSYHPSLLSSNFLERTQECQANFPFTIMKDLSMNLNRVNYFEIITNAKEITFTKQCMITDDLILITILVFD